MHLLTWTRCEVGSKLDRRFKASFSKRKLDEVIVQVEITDEHIGSWQSWKQSWLAGFVFKNGQRKGSNKLSAELQIIVQWGKGPWAAQTFQFHKQSMGKRLNYIHSCKVFACRRSHNVPLLEEAWCVRVGGFAISCQRRVNGALLLVFIPGRHPWSVW